MEWVATLLTPSEAFVDGKKFRAELPIWVKRAGRDARFRTPGGIPEGGAMCDKEY